MKAKKRAISRQQQQEKKNSEEPKIKEITINRTHMNVKHTQQE